MVSPIRCGGSGYNEAGEYYLIIGGIPRSQKEYDEIKAKLQQSYEEECEVELAKVLGQIHALEPNWAPDFRPRKRTYR